MASINPFGGGGDTLPIDDATAVVKGSTDATKLVRIEADGLTTATTRVITMADQDIDLTPDTGTFAAAGAGGGLIFLSSVTASASATVDIETTFDSTFDWYMITITDLITDTDDIDIVARMKLGGSYDAGANYRYHTHIMNSNAGTYSSVSSNAATEFELMQQVGNTAGEGAQMVLQLSGPSGTALAKKLQWHGVTTGNSGQARCAVGGGLNTSTTALTGVRFFTRSGNITSGIFSLYGITNS